VCCTAGTGSGRRPGHGRAADALAWTIGPVFASAHTLALRGLNGRTTPSHDRAKHGQRNGAQTKRHESGPRLAATAVIGIAGAVSMTAILALPPFLSLPADVPRTAAGTPVDAIGSMLMGAMFPAVFTIAFILPAVGGSWLPGNAQLRVACPESLRLMNQRAIWATSLPLH
jgi:hypothetical protein